MRKCQRERVGTNYMIKEGKIIGTNYETSLVICANDSDGARRTRVSSYAVIGRRIRPSSPAHPS